MHEERTPLGRVSVYARSKNALCIALEEEFSAAECFLCWFRVFHPCGAGEHPSRLCTSIALKLTAGHPVILKTPQSVKDYVYIDDMAEALLTVLLTGTRGAINIGTGIGTTFQEMAQTLGESWPDPR